MVGREAHFVANPARRANHFCSPESCQALKSEIFRFTGILIYGRDRLSPCRQRDVSRSSRSVVRVAMDACGVSAVQTVQAKTPQRTAKSCGPGAATLASIRPCLFGDGNGDNKGRSPGRARISRKAIARGRPGCLGCTCQTRVRLFTTHCTRCCGRSRRPVFPAPSQGSEGQRDGKPRAKHAAGTRRFAGGASGCRTPENPYVGSVKRGRIPRFHLRKRNFLLSLTR